MTYSFSKGEFPPCFHCAADYQRWLDTQSTTNSEVGDAEFCTDCLPTYKSSMQQAGRCSHPETVFAFKYENGFDLNEDGWFCVFGHRQSDIQDGKIQRSEIQKKERNQQQRARQTRKSVVTRENAAVRAQEYWAHQRQLHEERLMLGLRR